MMFMSTLTKMSRLKPHLVAEKAKEKKRKEKKFSISANKMTISFTYGDAINIFSNILFYFLIKDM